MWETIISSIALFIAFCTLLYTSKSIRELVSTQRAQTGPLIKITITSDSCKQNRVGPTNQRAQSGVLWNVFLNKSGKRKVVYPSNNKFDLLPFINKWDINIIGELPYNSIIVKNKKQSRFIINVENVQDHLSGIASDFTIELVGLWIYSINDKLKTKSGLIHLRGYCELINPKEKKIFCAPDYGKLSAFSIHIRHLSYRDIWGHKCHAYFGHKGCLYTPSTFENNLHTWESVIPDIPAGNKDIILKIRIFSLLAKERIKYLFNQLFIRS